MKDLCFSPEAFVAMCKYFSLKMTGWMLQKKFSVFTMYEPATIVRTGAYTVSIKTTKATAGSFKNFPGRGVTLTFFFF